MNLRSTRFRYGAVAQSFHWLTAILVVATRYFGPGGTEERVYSSALDSTRQTHETLGITVFVLVLVRLLWRLLDATPEDPPMMPWMKYAARAVQAALYVLLIAIPVSAIAGAWLEAHPLTMWGFGGIAPMLPANHDLGRAAAVVHTTLANVFLWVGGVHAGAAILHHVLLRDRVLLLMVPGNWHWPERLVYPRNFAR